MHIVFPEGSGCVQRTEDLAFVKGIGTVDYYETPLRARQTSSIAPDADAVFLDYSVMDAEVIQSCPRLKFICFFGIGYGNCMTSQRPPNMGDRVLHAGYGATAVAEYTLGLMLALTGISRHPITASSTASGCPPNFRAWTSRKTLGIVGLGPIGADMARLGAGVGMPLLGWTRSAAADRAQHGLLLVTLEHLFPLPTS